MQLLRDEEKNKILQQERGISFEDIQIYIDNWDIVDIIDHYNQIKYPHQQLILVNIKDYIYAIPCVIQSDWSFFLKTIYPSRDYTKLYLSKPQSWL